MSKNEEVLLLQSMIDAFPSDSYIGQWIREVSTEIVSDIQSDFIPSATPGRTRQVMRENLARAEATAKEIVGDAEKKAARILKDAETKAAEEMAKVNHHRRCLRALAEQVCEAIK